MINPWKMHACQVGLFAILVAAATFSTPASAAPPPIPSPIPSDVDRVAESKQWLRLGHYRASAPFGRIKSEIDQKEFFFSPDGPFNPRSELEATLAAFQARATVKLPPDTPDATEEFAVCTHPGRAHFLRSQGFVFPEVSCERLRTWFTKLAPKQASLVFSSAYPNNPGSMFGHTFLKVSTIASGASPKDKSDLLDSGVSYAALVGPDDGNFFFVWNGLTGGYKGRFSLLPYYAKVHEYVRSESRDLWEYELALTPQEVEMMMLHLYELDRVGTSDYYFLDENCSYRILTVLEVARPDWDLTPFALFTIPAETIKVLMRIPGAVSAVKFRPSLRRKLTHQWDHLTASERSEVEDLLEGRVSAERVSAEQVSAQQASTTGDARVLTTVLTALAHERSRGPADFEAKRKPLQKDILIARSKISGTVSDEFQEPPLPENLRPERAHDPTRVGLLVGLNQSRERTHVFQEFNLRSAYHDILGADEGLAPFSQIHFPGFTFRYDSTASELQLTEAELVSVVSLFPSRWGDRRPSWRFRVAGENPIDRPCRSCVVGTFEGGGGFTGEWWRDRGIAFAMIAVDFEAGGAFESKMRLSPKLEVGVVTTLMPRLKLRLTSATLWDLFQDTRERFATVPEFGLSWNMAQDFELRASALAVLPTTETENRREEVKGGVYWYF